MVEPNCSQEELVYAYALTLPRVVVEYVVGSSILLVSILPIASLNPLPLISNE